MTAAAAAAATITARGGTGATKLAGRICRVDG